MSAWHYLAIPDRLIAGLLNVGDDCFRGISVHPARLAWGGRPVIDGVFHITYILNPGAAFSILENQTTLLVAVAVGMLAALAYFYRHIAAGPWLFRLGGRDC